MVGLGGHAETAEVAVADEFGDGAEGLLLAEGVQEGGLLHSTLLLYGGEGIKSGKEGSGNYW